MDKFNFLLGNWNMDYRIPKTSFNEEGTDKGVGRYKKGLDDKFVFFDYSTISGYEAKGVFAWDERIQAYRYWWFENTGNFLTATCDFIGEGVLAMNWHETLLVQTYVKESDDRLLLQMKSPSDQGGYEVILEVTFTRAEQETKP